MNDTKFFLSKAPIIQAILQIRVEEGIVKDNSTLQGLHKKFIENFPDQKKRIKGRFTFHSKTEQLLSQSEVDGYHFISSDMMKKIVVELDSFAYIQSNPYNSWEEFVEEAAKYWRIYKDFIQPKGISRLSVRYVNKIEIELPINDLRDHFKTYIVIPEDLPQTIQSFYFKFTIPYKDQQTLANISLTAGKAEGIKVPFLLDIDVLDLKNRTIEEQEIWENFNILRNYKNSVFKNCLTDSLFNKLK